MEGYWQFSGRFNQNPRLLDIYCSIRAKRTGHDAIDVELAGDVNVAAHHLHFIVRIDKCATARPDEHEHRNANSLGNLADQCGTGGSAAVMQIGAQLDTVRASALGCEGGFESF